MPILTLIIVLVAVGVIMYLINVYIGPKMKPPFLQILNAVVVIVVILWLLRVFGILGSISNIRV